ncbi:VOC family protein [Taibaiella lutea]|uniref:VOC family protein n=1 Tax=Taibaiella lutea TaxID=2608001 RepID=A0A5M6CMJ0_9BACT|nr:VOC family protein [Taibaiella lutea]KAA5536428.1 VOC family protein [Taibaiella lutea]
MNDNKHPTYGNGKICYIEMPSLDVNVSADFYEAVFGWEIRRRDDGSVAFNDGVGEVSGTWLTHLKPATEKGSMLISIMVENIPATIDLITRYGGNIISVDMQSKEKTAKFSDPAGNVFGLYQSSMGK